MSKVTLIQGRTYSVLGVIFHIGVPQEVRDDFIQAARLADNKRFRVQTAPSGVEEAEETVELSKDELMAALSAAGVDYNPKSYQATLQKLYDKHCAP